MIEQRDINMPDISGFETAVHAVGMAAPAPGFTSRWRVYAEARKYENAAFRGFVMKAAAILGGMLLLSLTLFFCLFCSNAVLSTYFNFLPEFVNAVAVVGTAVRKGLFMFHTPAILCAGLAFAVVIALGGYRLITRIAVRSLEKEGVSTNAEIH